MAIWEQPIVVPTQPTGATGLKIAIVLGRQFFHEAHSRRVRQWPAQLRLSTGRLTWCRKTLCDRGGRGSQGPAPVICTVRSIARSDVDIRSCINAQQLACGLEAE